MQRRPVHLTLVAFLYVLSLSGQSLDIQNYRTFDGYSNNLEHPAWGAAGENLLRITGNGYADGVAAPGGVNRPNPRSVSNAIFSQSGLINDPLNLSDFCWVFGQFIDHDIGLTPDGPEPLIIAVPKGDPWFDPLGVGQAIIPMHRNVFDPATGTGPDNPRNHPNLITAFIDGSGIYGSSEERANWLRAFEGGKLKTSKGNMLPFNTTTGEFDAPIDPDAPHMDNPVGISDKFYVSGDARANENPLLLAFHTLFMREHNRLCEEMAVEHPDWNDEQLYQHARKMVGGEIQAIVFNEWLPVMGVELSEYKGYQPDVNPQLMQIFTGAAFRVGHTLLNGTLRRLNPDGDTMDIGNMSLRDAFFNPFAVRESGGIEPFLQGMASQTQQSFDAKVVDDVRNFLFGPPGAGGLDLASININRGRERGLPDFNSVRRNLGLQPYYFFQQISFIPETVSRLNSLYQSIHNIDPWVGMLAESPMRGALFGETIMTILQRQFGALRDGDRFFYLNDPVLSEAEKKAIHYTTMHDVIMRNTGIKLMQDNVFEAMPHSMICDNMLVEVSGSIETEAGDPVPGVTVRFDHGGEQEYLETPTSGLFEFSPVGGCQMQELQLSKNDKAINGVSTLDLILIQKHVLDIQLLDSPYKLIAADINNSGSISTLDIIALRKVVLGMAHGFENNRIWRFIPADFTFTDPADPFADEWPETLHFDVLGQDVHLDYVAVKIGDVNSSARLSESLDRPVAEVRSEKNALELLVEDQPVVAGQTVSVVVSAGAMPSLLGYQFSLSVPSDGFHIIGVSGEGLENLQPENFGVFPEEGKITTSWNLTAPVSLQKGLPLFRLDLLALKNGRLSQMLRLGETMEASAYDGSLNTVPVSLVFGQDVEKPAGFALQQNHPNPFRATTTIPFYLPEEGIARLTVFDAAGRALLVRSGRFSAGQHQWALLRTDLPATGVLHYRVETTHGAATRKMIAFD